MWFRSLLKTLKSRESVASVRRRSRRMPALQPRLESLEDRSLPSTVSLAPSDPAPQLVGESVTWTATAEDVGTNPVYQFSAAPHGGAFHVVRDYSPANSFVWTPMQEGAYDIQVTVKDGYQATETISAVAVDEVASRVTEAAVVTSTDNPLVALYSVPPSSAETVFVQFAVAGDDPIWRNTNSLPIVPGKSTNVFVAGMLPSSTYQMRHVFSDGTASSSLHFTTGALPTTLTFPTYTVVQPPGPESDPGQDIIFHQSARSPLTIPNPLATDLQGNVMWYYDPTTSGLTFTFPIQSLVSGGTVLVVGVDPYTALPNSRNVLREIDLAGNPIRETNLAAINAQLTALGHDDVVHSFTNDVQRLPDGRTAAIGITERTIDVDGTPTDIIGMSIIVLDADFQVAWAWNGFDHMDVGRAPVLGEIVQAASTGPTTAVPRLPAVDWLHINAVSWSPTDENLVLSVRHQDWVVKIDYRGGAGDGRVVWRLGQGGDFALVGADPTAWFSHQHNAHYIDASTLVLLDNGNTRRHSDPTANSRGQVWQLDEKTMTATVVINADLGRYAGAVGAAQRLSNGNYYFNLGITGPEPPRPPARLVEVTPDGTKVYELESARTEYRSYRMRTLYEGVSDARAGMPRTVESVVLNDGSAQRAMVNQITVTFSGAVVLDPGAIELRRQDGSLVDAQFSIALEAGNTVAVLTFAGPEFVGGSLADGSYTLTVRADRVHDRWGRELDGDGDGSAGGDAVAGFFRLFGDGDGDHDVDHADLDLMLSSFGRSQGQAGFLWFFDHDGDGDVDGLDMAQFNHRRRI